MLMIDEWFSNMRLAHLIKVNFVEPWAAVWIWWMSHRKWNNGPHWPPYCTVLVLRMAQRKWKDTKQQPCTAGPGNMLGCCLIYFHFQWAILSTSTVHSWFESQITKKYETRHTSLLSTYPHTLLCKITTNSARFALGRASAVFRILKVCEQKMSAAPILS